MKTSKKKIDFLKVDTQGTELSVLKGAKKLLAQKKISVLKLEVTTIPVYKNQVLFSEIDLFLRDLNYTLVDFITYREEYTPALKKIIVPRHSGPCGDAIYVLNTDEDSKSDLLKKGLTLMWLGYPSLSLNILDKSGLSASEKNIILRTFQPEFKQRLKLFFKNLTPPFIWQLARRIKTHKQSIRAQNT